MLKKMVIVLMAAVFLAAMGRIALYSEETVVSKGQAVEVGNKVCPVSKEDINENTKATYEYKGKIYNFCCKACIPAFKKDPEKYIKIIEQEKQKKTEPGANTNMEKQHHHGE